MIYIMALKNMWRKKQPLEMEPQKNSYSAFQHQKMESCKILSIFSSQACKNTFWEVRKPASAGEVVHKISLQIYFKNHVLETVSIESISH